MRKIIRVASFLFFLILFLILAKSLFLNYYPDFTVHYYSPKVILVGQNPYLEKGNSFIPDVYPPFAILLFSPFALFSFPIAEKAWTILSMLSLFAAVYLIFKSYNRKLFSSLGFFILGLVCFSFPVKFTLGMGQINNFILLLFVSSVYFLEKKKNFLSSFFLSVSFAIKFFPLFFPLYFLLKRKWKVLFSIVISLAILSFVAFIINPQINLYFYKNVLPTLANGWKTDYYNQSLVGAIGRSFVPGIFREILKDVLSLAFILISFFAIFRSLKNDKLQNMHLGLLVTLNLIVNNFSWQHHFVFMIFPFLVTLFYVQKMKNNLKAIFIIFISYALISFNFKNPNDFPVLLQSHVFYGAVLMWMTEVYLIWRGSPPLQLRFPSASKH